ncbi:family 20 glycosylhydrolase [Lysobacter sp. M15]|uniref:beta-N-acetylhexosaminidase n=1 Tax=Lysobacter sp. M15 TaxID=2916837 RepID=UPI001F574262|nr:family 20 glycosylhydrolase [Lysobacter sp. M15]
MRRASGSNTGGFKTWALLLLATLAAGCGDAPGPQAADAKQTPAVQPATAVPALPLIPMPASTARGEGGFPVRADTPVIAAANDPAARQAAQQFARLLEESFGAAPRVSDAGDAGHAIAFITDPQLKASAEGYVLEVSSDGVRIRARGAAGLFYGGVSLWQLLSADGENQLPVTLPAVRIDDAPRFAWRGFMLDSARHLQSVGEIKRLLDQMARHKLNVFHWHLTDDQGWRLEIKRYPKLTQVGAWRVPAGKAGRDSVGKPVRYGGFYTQAQAREIVEYARQLHITVVPEIELPGHAQAAIASYPELGVTGKAPPVSPDWGVHTWLFNVEDPTFTFLENVLNEVMAVFPGQYIHIGGDEADKYQWQRSSQVQARRKALGLADDMQLQSWFIKRIEKFLVAHERRLIGWDEILEGGLPPEATVMSWRGTKGAVEAARQGHDVVLTPSDVTYLNRMQSEEVDEPPAHDYPTPLKAVYDFEPVPPELDAEQAKHVMGTQANLWTEHVRTEARVEHMAFPRLSALAEVAWSPKASRDWNGFLQRLAPQMRRFAHAGIRAADSAFAVRIEAQSQGDGAQVALANQAGFGELRYTTDGSEPTARSELYAQPLQLKLPATVSANAFLDGKPLARTRSQRIDAALLRSRDAEQLAPCRKQGYVLRVEDDEPLQGERAVVPVDIAGPCWLWKQAPLEGAASLRAEIVDLPYNFQFGGESAAAAPPNQASAPAALQVFGNTCEGRPLASAKVAQTDAATEQLDIALPSPMPTRDLCLKFSGDYRHTLWAIDRVELVPAAR